MRRGALLLALLLAACSGADERAPDAPPTEAVAEAPAPTPTPAPSATPVDCGDQRNGGYDNAKVCYYDQCNKGDAEACRMADSFNGNLFPDGASKGLRLEDMDYLDARKEILALGWQPLEGPCEGVSDEACVDFPEIGNCNCCGICDLNFRRGDRCLVVIISDGWPDRSIPDSAPVERVRFSKAPCSKDPNERGR